MRKRLAGAAWSDDPAVRALAWLGDVDALNAIAARTRPAERRAPRKGAKPERSFDDYVAMARAVAAQVESGDAPEDDRWPCEAVDAATVLGAARTLRGGEDAVALASAARTLADAEVEASDRLALAAELDAAGRLAARDALLAQTFEGVDEDDLAEVSPALVARALDGPLREPLLAGLRSIDGASWPRFCARIGAPELLEAGYQDRVAAGEVSRIGCATSEAALRALARVAVTHAPPAVLVHVYAELPDFRGASIFLEVLERADFLAVKDLRAAVAKETWSGDAKSVLRAWLERAVSVSVS
jgi:hypothetical protein